MIKKIIFVILFCMLIVSATNAEASGLSRRQRFVQFLAGTELVRNSTTFTEGEKNRALIRLSKITGITRAQTDRMIADCKARPDEWKKILDEVEAVLEKL